MPGPVPTVPKVDLAKYLGKWYEIAAFPQWFENHGENGGYVTANYALKKDGTIEVVNTMRVGSKEGKEKVSRGRAYVADKATNSKIRVSFFRPFYGDYWILDLGENEDGSQYLYSLVGAPNRKFLWILSRTPTLDEAIVEKLKAKAAELGFDVTKLKITKQ